MSHRKDDGHLYSSGLFIDFLNCLDLFPTYYHYLGPNASHYRVILPILKMQTTLHGVV